MSRQEMVLDDKNKNFVELMSFMEGNNRMGAAIMMMFNSAYDSKTGRIECDTLDKDWVIKNLVARDPDVRSKSDVAKSL